MKTENKLKDMTTTYENIKEIVNVEGNTVFWRRNILENESTTKLDSHNPHVDEKF